MFATEFELGAAAGDATPDVRLVRWELFLFRSVRDVLPGPRDGVVVVIHRGPARPEAWLAVLRDAGLLPAEVPARARD